MLWMKSKSNAQYSQQRFDGPSGLTTSRMWQQSWKRQPRVWSYGGTVWGIFYINCTDTSSLSTNHRLSQSGLRLPQCKPKLVGKVWWSTLRTWTVTVRGRTTSVSPSVMALRVRISAWSRSIELLHATQTEVVRRSPDLGDQLVLHCHSQVELGQVTASATVALVWYERAWRCGSVKELPSSSIQF